MRRYRMGWFWLRRMRRLVTEGLVRLACDGTTDDCGHRHVYLMWGSYYCLVSAIGWGVANVHGGSRLFFTGLRRPWNPWSHLGRWDWLMPRDPRVVTLDACWLLWRVSRRQLRTVLRIVRHGRLITAEEYACATLLGG